MLLALATAALVLPSLAAQLHSPAGGHETQLSVAVAIILLAIFALSLPASLRRQAEPVTGRSLAVEQHPSPLGTDGEQRPAIERRWPAALRSDRRPWHGTREETVEGHTEGHWPIWLATVLLALAGVAAGLVSDWFVDALQPAIDALHISPAFAGLVIVAIAGNAVENVVGIQLAARNQADYAVSVIVNSPIQIALVLAPALVLLSFLTATTLTLVFAPLLVVSVVVAVIITAFIIFDGESNWLEGAILIALYAIIATLFWWG